MESKTYAVSVHRTSTDYILITAANEDEARARAEMLLDEGSAAITMGDDGSTDSIGEVEISKAEGGIEKNDLESNDEAIADLESEDGVSI